MMTLHKCPRCQSIRSTVRSLTRDKAMTIMQGMAAEIRKERPGLSIENSQEIAMQSILLKAPKFIVTCDQCSYENFYQGDSLCPSPNA